MHLLLHPWIVSCFCFHSFDLKGRESFSSGQRGGEDSKTVQLQPGPEPLSKGYSGTHAEATVPLLPCCFLTLLALLLPPPWTGAPPPLYHK
jgi:hypothetical protein